MSTKNNRKTIVIQTTENCNLKCSYCYQHIKTPKKIDIQTLKNIIDENFLETDDFDEIEFDFIGGEPLLYTELIMEICEWTWKQSFYKPNIFFVTTNGTLLPPSFKKWATLNKDKIWLGISLDGTKEMHDTNRSNSYDAIDIQYFLTNWPIQPIKMTVSPLTLGEFAEGVISLHEAGFLVNANLAYGVDWSNPEYIEILSAELLKLIDYYLQNDKEPIMHLKMPLFNLLSNNREKYCGAGTGMKAYDINGKVHPCQLFYGVSMPNDDSWQAIDFSCVHHKYYENCYSKDFFNLCPICIGMNYSQNKNEYKCDKSLCELMHVFFKANAYFQTKQIMSDKFKLEQIEETAKAIKLINKHFKTKSL